jgi:hypothetical protein
MQEKVSCSKQKYPKRIEISKEDITVARNGK